MFSHVINLELGDQLRTQIHLPEIILGDYQVFGRKYYMHLLKFPASTKHNAANVRSLPPSISTSNTIG